MRARFFVYSLYAFTGIFLAACASDTTERAFLQEGDGVRYKDLEIELPENQQVSAKKTALAEAINNDEMVSFSQITDMLIDEHAAAFNKGKEKKAKVRGPQIEEFLTKISKDLKAKDPHALKTGYEAKIEKIAGAELMYNKDAVTIANISQENRLQCFSGTSLHQIMSRRLQTGEGFTASNSVVIFESGHVLSGYVKEDEDGDFQLIGIETTASGRAELDYGKTKNLSGPVRVVDAGRWAVIEIFKFDMTNLDQMVPHIVEWTAEKYDIDLDRAQIPQGTPVALAGIGEESKQLSGKMNTSPFSFGASNTPAGDIKRSQIDRRKHAPSAFTAISGLGGSVGFIDPRFDERRLDEMDVGVDDPELQRILEAIVANENSLGDYNTTVGPISIIETDGVEGTQDSTTAVEIGRLSINLVIRIVDAKKLKLPERYIDTFLSSEVRKLWVAHISGIDLRVSSPITNGQAAKLERLVRDLKNATPYVSGKLYVYRDRESFVRFREPFVQDNYTSFSSMTNLDGNGYVGIDLLSNSAEESLDSDQELVENLQLAWISLSRGYSAHWIFLRPERAETLINQINNQRND